MSDDVKSKAEIRAKLTEARDDMNRVLDQVGDRWEQQVYSDGLRWNVRQVLVHVSEADRGHNFQAMSYAEGKDAIPADFDIERYNARTTEKFAARTPAEARADMARNRQVLLDW